jgi:hypothetical protein
LLRTFVLRIQQEVWVRNKLQKDNRSVSPSNRTWASSGPVQVVIFLSHHMHQGLSHSCYSNRLQQQQHCISYIHARACTYNTSYSERKWHLAWGSRNANKDSSSKEVGAHPCRHTVHGDAMNRTVTLLAIAEGYSQNNQWDIISTTTTTTVYASYLASITKELP